MQNGYGNDWHETNFLSCNIRTRTLLSTYEPRAWQISGAGLRNRTQRKHFESNYRDTCTRGICRVLQCRARQNLGGHFIKFDQRRQKGGNKKILEIFPLRFLFTSAGSTLCLIGNPIALGRKLARGTGRKGVERGARMICKK